MREIKFRGKDKKTGHWRIGHLIQNHTSTWIGNTGTALKGWFEVEPESVGQFTGLKDKKGKEIFEGDILESDDGRDKVVFKKGAFVLESSSGLLDEPMYEFVDTNYFEVIGNIYENPELLEK